MKLSTKKFLVATLATATFFTASTSANAEKISDGEKVPAVENKFDAEQVSDAEKYLVKGVSDESEKNYPFSIEARYFSPHFDAQVQSNKIHYNGGRVGLKDNLGFGNDKAPEFILKYKHLTLDYIRLSGDGDRTFSGRDVLTYGGTRLHGQLHSKSQLHFIKLSVKNNIKSINGTGFDWSYGITGLFWKGKVNGTNSSGRREERSEDYGVPIPTVGVGAHARLWDNLNAFAHISGLPLGGYGHFYDFEAGLHFKPTEHFGVTAGFRRIHANIHHKDENGNFTMNGPYFGLRADF